MNKKIYRFFLLPILAISACIAILFAALQTPKAQQYLADWVILEAKKKGITLEIEGLSGLAPTRWQIAHIRIAWEDKVCDIRNAKIRLHLLALCQKKLSLSFFTADSIHVFFPSSSSDLDIHTLPSLTFPFDFSANILRIDELILTDCTTQNSLSLSIEGKATTHYGLQELAIALHIEEKKGKSLADITALSSRKKGIIQAQVFLSITNSAPLTTFLQTPISFETKTTFCCEGPWTFWRNFSQKKEGDPLLFSGETTTTFANIEAPFFINRTWNFSSHVFLHPDLSFTCNQCYLDSDWLRFIGKIDLSSSWQPRSCFALITIEDLSLFSPYLPVPIKGKLKAKTGLTENSFTLSLASASLQIGKQLFTPSFLESTALCQNGTWKGKAEGKLQNALLPWEGSVLFEASAEKIEIDNMSVLAAGCKMGGQGSYTFANATAIGSLFFSSPDLKPFRTLFPTSNVEGRMGGSIACTYAPERLSVKADLVFRNIRYQSTLIDLFTLGGSFTNILQQPTGNLQIECENLCAKHATLHTFHLFSKEQPDHTQKLTIEAEGMWKQPFTLSSESIWSKNAQEFSLHCLTFSGKLLNNFFSANPFIYTHNEQGQALSSVCLHLGSGMIAIEGTHTSTKSSGNIKATHIPIDAISLLYPKLQMQGLLSAEGSYTLQPQMLEAVLLATLDELHVVQSGKKKSTQAKGSLQIHIENATAQVHAHIHATQNQFIDLTATIPILYELSPLHLSSDIHKPVSGEIIMQGALEKIFDFLQTGNQTASGWITTHLLLSNTLSHPSLLGQIHVQKGRYEHYLSGVHLQNIEAHLIANGHSLVLEHCQANDSYTGTATATGELEWDRDRHFPFKANVSMDTLQWIRSPLWEATTSGSFQMTGTMNNATITGNLQANDLLFSIAENIQADIPSLPITYINPPIHLQRSLISPSSTTFPIELSLEVEAPGHVWIKGRGLESEWKGNVHLTGTPTDPIGKGALTLQKGEFIFSGKTFSLVQGELFFSDQPGQSSYLHLSGQLQKGDTTITALLQGPLQSPQLTFQSSPPLPTSSILAILLFNKDISEISPIQTLQLAQVIMTLSGNGGPDVLTAIRKTIGVDKLSIAEKEGTEEIALQIGWYLSHGITVSLSQSATSSDVTVEVDLKNGFIFEAETQNQEEGKFSLKWNKNY